MNVNEKLENIKSSIINLLDNNKGLLKHSIKNDCEGYLYCITNNILNVYNMEVYKVGNTSDIVKRLMVYNNSYFELIKVKNFVSVPYKTMFETLLFIKLKKYRITNSKEFLFNHDKINEQFLLIDELIKNNDKINSLEKYYLYVMENQNDEELNEIDIKMDKKINCNLEKINYGLKIKNKIKNYKKNDCEGYLIHVDIPEIKYNFDDEVQSVVILKKYTTTITEFVGIITVRMCLKVHDVSLARLIFYDMLNGTRIKNKYFLCSYDKIKEVFEKIQYYFKNYSSSEKIKKAYLYEYYNEGEKINPDNKNLNKINYGKKKSNNKTNKGITEEDFKLHYGSQFDILRRKLFCENNEENQQKTKPEKVIKNTEETNIMTMEKIKTIIELKSTYKSKFEIYRKMIDSDEEEDDEETLYNEYLLKYYKEKEKYEIKNNEEMVKSLKELYPSRYDRYTNID